MTRTEIRQWVAEDGMQVAYEFAGDCPGALDLILERHGALIVCARDMDRRRGLVALGEVIGATAAELVLHNRKARSQCGTQ